MSRVRSILIVVMSLFIFGCTAGTSGTKPDTSHPSQGKINCAQFDLSQMTREEYRFCHDSGK